MGRGALPAAIVAAFGGLFVVARRVFGGRVPDFMRVLRDADDSTVMDQRTGAVRSVQSAEVLLPAERLHALWAPPVLQRPDARGSPLYLERLARTYWRFLTRATLGLVRVYYTDRERFVCLLHPRFK